LERQEGRAVIAQDHVIGDSHRRDIGRLIGIGQARLC